MDHTGPDWEVESWYLGRRQPPLAARLDTVIKFLAEEDVDRCMHWETKFEEVTSYLKWLARDDDRHQVKNASPGTQAMFNDAVTKVKAHVLFEAHHYRPTPVEIPKPLEGPLTSARFNWLNKIHDQSLLPSDDDPGRSSALPRSLSDTALRKIRERIDHPQWTPPSLETSQLPGQIETMPYTVSYRKRLKEITKLRELAWSSIENDNDGRLAGLPRALVYGGPFARPTTDPDTQVKQELLKQCYTTVEMLKAAYHRVPRPLLKSVSRLLGREEKGEFRHHLVPDGLRLAGDEWERVEEQTLPRYVDLGDIQWLKFLAGECVNDGNWTGRFAPDTSRGEDRLLLLFATKVQKLLDDRNREGLFSQHDAEVKVEDLLKAINAGKDSSAVMKHEFHPDDAGAWLERMNETGHISFRPDSHFYGIVKRPLAQYFPEHRVLWPTTAGDGERPPFSSESISDWRRIIHEGHKPDISEGSTIWNFFLSLAFRLGYTMSLLEQDLRAGNSNNKNNTILPTPPLHESITAFETTYTSLQLDNNSNNNNNNAAEPTPSELTLIRTKIIDEISANETMLAPGREHHYVDGDGNAHTVLVRDHNWDWASLRARGQSERRQFWSVDRWPPLDAAPDEGVVHGSDAMDLSEG